MKPFRHSGIVNLLAFINGIATAIAQGDASATVSTSSTKSSKSLTTPWGDPAHTPSTFTTVSLTYSDYGQKVAAAIGRPTHVSGPVDDRRNSPTQMDVEESHETLTIYQAYRTITITLSGIGTAALYTGTVLVESMVTLGSGTHTTTEAVEMTVTDATQDSNTDVAAPSSVYSNSISLAPSGVPSSSVSTTLSGSVTTATHFHEPTATALSGNVTSRSSTDAAASTTIPAKPSMTESSTAGAAPTAVKKVVGALFGLAGAALFIL